MTMINIQIADFSNPAHASAVVYLLNEYAKDPMGGGEELSDFAKTNLVNKTAQAAYVANGFVGYQLVSEMGQAMFWQKKI